MQCSIPLRSTTCTPAGLVTKAASTSETPQPPFTPPGSEVAAESASTGSLEKSRKLNTAVTFSCYTVPRCV